MLKFQKILDKSRIGVYNHIVRSYSRTADQKCVDGCGFPPHAESAFTESCRLVQGSQRFVRKIIPEQPAQRVQNPCKQRRLQPLPCRALLEARERVCTARQREWYRRELDDHKVFVSWFNRGQRPFLLKRSSPGTCKKWKKVRKTGETHHAVERFSDFCGGSL